MAGEIGMARHVTEDGAVTAAIGDVFQDRGHRNVARAMGQKDARRQPHAIGHGNPDRVEDLEAHRQVVANGELAHDIRVTDCRGEPCR